MDQEEGTLQNKMKSLNFIAARTDRHPAGEIWSEELREERKKAKRRDPKNERGVTTMTKGKLSRASRA